MCLYLDDIGRFNFVVLDCGLLCVPLGGWGAATLEPGGGWGAATLGPPGGVEGSALWSGLPPNCPPPASSLDSLVNVEEPPSVGVVLRLPLSRVLQSERQRK